MNASVLIFALALGQTEDAPAITDDPLTPGTRIAPPSAIEDDRRIAPSRGFNRSRPTSTRNDPSPDLIAPSEEKKPAREKADDRSPSQRTFGPRRPAAAEIEQKTSPYEELPEQTAPPAQAKAPAMPAEPQALLEQALAAPKSSRLTGEPLTLAAAIARRSDRESQLRIVHAYWKLSAATAAYYFSIDEDRWLKRITEAIATRADDALRFESAVAASHARVQEAYLVALAAQHELRDAIGRTAQDSLALPSDLPHVGSYATRFSELFVSRQPPKRARLIHESLPAVQKAIVARAQSALALARAIEASHEPLEQQKIRIDTYLYRLEELNDARRAFLAIVRAYNDDIADYALNATQENLSQQDLVGMLIRPRATDNPASRKGSTTASERGWQRATR
jgi:hypothetical protein